MTSQSSIIINNSMSGTLNFNWRKKETWRIEKENKELAK